MNVNVQKFALSVAGFLGAVYLACAAVVAAFPELATTLFGWIVHLVNVEPLEFGLTVGAVAGGLVQILLYSYGVAWAIGALAVHFLVPSARATGR